MKISLNWLKEYVDIPDDLQAFCDRLDLTGTGVEGVEKTGEQFDKVVTARIVSKTAHPDSDHMWVCKVDVGSYNVNEAGENEPLQIVCGAQNFNEGDHVVTALIGACLPGDFKIKKSKLRGVDSCGMNCSEDELGLGGEHDGIIVLPPDAPVGVPFAEYRNMQDTILDLEITPNRPDCLSVLGLANEVGAMYLKPVCAPIFELEEARNKPKTSELVDVEITDPDRCPRYTARVIKNVKVGPSPEWLAKRVTAMGGRSINNIVDVTNYILYLFGQPLHAFDYDKLASKDGKAHIIVRPAEDGEHFTTLDGVERELTSDMTVIATPEAAVALAGVMGGLESEISEESISVLLETATFHPGHTSRTSRHLNLISESSMRYERRVDDVPCAEYADAAAALIAEVSGGVVCPGLVDNYPQPTQPRKLKFRINRFNKMMGIKIPRDAIIEILEHLNCTVVAPAHADTIDVTTPTSRPDLEREIDLYEEVLRLWGMDKVDSTLPESEARVGRQTKQELFDRKVHKALCASGLNETMTYSFADKHDIETLGSLGDEAADPVELLNPMNVEQCLLRQSIIPGLLRSVAYNQAHGVKNIALYEMGRVFSTQEGQKKPTEERRIAAVLAGALQDESWNVKAQAFDFFDGKGVVELLAQELAIPKLRFKEASGASSANGENGAGASKVSHLQPGRAAHIFTSKTYLGWVGEIHPLVLKDFEAQGPVVAFELNVEVFRQAAQDARRYHKVPEFPPVDVDLALVVDEDITHETLKQRIESAGGKYLEDVRLFDVYQDEKRLGQHKKSLAYSLRFRAYDKTLTSEKVDEIKEKIIRKVNGSLNAEIRK